MADGALLSAPYEPTTGGQYRQPSEPPPTEILYRSVETKSVAAKPRSNAMYVVLGAMVLIILVLAAVIAIPRWWGTWNENDSARPTNATTARPNEQTPAEPRGSSSTNAPTTTGSHPENETPDRTGAAAATVLGVWQGQWSSPRGTIYDGRLSLEPSSSPNTVQGRIDWTLRTTTGNTLKTKIGLSGVEYVRGEFEPTSGKLTMTGYGEDDPNNIITPDRYRLELSADRNNLTGLTWNHGNWSGRLELRR